MKPSPLWFRDLLGVALCATLLTAGCEPAARDELADASDARAEARLFRLNERRASDWFEPSVIRPEVDEVKLSVRYRDHELDGQRLNLRSYYSPQAAINGLVGPTFRVKAGDVLRLSLANELPTEPNCDRDNHQVPSCFNDTNLHTHGLHISPNRHSDYVLLNLKPGDPPEKYELHILPSAPAGIQTDGTPHYPGTFWYHAHRHGSTAVQVASGMAGALIVEDPGEIQPIRGIQERVMVLQQLAFDADGEVKGIDDLFCNFAGTESSRYCRDKFPNAGLGKYTTINGRVKPTITMRPNEVQRWRIIDAGIVEEVMLHLNLTGEGAQPMQLIAIDGITRARPTTEQALRLLPGYRRDVLFKAPAWIPDGARLEMRKDSPSFRFLGAPEDVDRNTGRQILAQVVLEGPDCEPDPECVSSLLDPDSLESPLRPIGEDEVAGREVKKVVFNIEARGEPARQQYLVNDREYDDREVHPEFQLDLGKADEWELVSEGGGHHPFHIHVNAFQRIGADGTPGDWHDTILVEPGKPLRMRTRYERFTGRFVLHCHILEHEDRGMMQLVEIR